MTYVSASQISTFRDCPRKWAWGYIEGIRSPPNKSAQLGINVHKILEHWFTTKQAPDLNTKEGQIAGSGLQHSADAFTHDCRAEQKFEFEFDGVTYLGYIDLHYATYLDGHVPEEDPIHELVVTDHKTTSDFKWAKSEEDLRTDPQRVIYAAWATIAYGVEKVRAKWIYYLTNPPYRSRVVELAEARDEIWDRFAEVHETAKEITHAKRHLKVLDLEQNLHACDAYGGCFYKERCIGNMSAKERMKAVLAQGARAERAARAKHAPAIAPASAGEPNKNKNLTSAVVAGAKQNELNETKRKTMSFLDRLKNKETNGKAAGMDPAVARKAYEAQQKKEEAAAAAKTKTKEEAKATRSTNGPAAPKLSIKEQLAALKAKKAAEEARDDDAPPISETLEGPDENEIAAAIGNVVDTTSPEGGTTTTRRTRGPSKPKEPKEPNVTVAAVTELTLLQACAQGGLSFDQATEYLEAFEKLTAA